MCCSRENPLSSKCRCLPPFDKFGEFDLVIAPGQLFWGCAGLSSSPVVCICVHPAYYLLCLVSASEFIWHLVADGIVALHVRNFLNTNNKSPTSPPNGMTEHSIGPCPRAWHMKAFSDLMPPSAWQHHLPVPSKPGSSHC